MMQRTTTPTTPAKPVKTARVVNIVNMETAGLSTLPTIEEKARGKYAVLTSSEAQKEIFFQSVTKMVAIGATHADLANAFGVSARSIEVWLAKYIEFKEAYEDGEKEAVQRMRQNMYQMGVGYEMDDVAVVTEKYVEYDEITGKRIRSVQKPTTVRYPKPMPKNAWAANRFLEIHDKSWKSNDKIVAGTVNIQNNYDLTVFSEEDLKALEKMGMKKILDAQNDNLENL